MSQILFVKTLVKKAIEAEKHARQRKSGSRPTDLFIVKFPSVLERCVSSGRAISLQSGKTLLIHNSVVPDVNLLVSSLRMTT